MNNGGSVAGFDYDLWSEAFRGNDRSLAEGESTSQIKLLFQFKGWACTLPEAS